MPQEPADKPASSEASAVAPLPTPPKRPVAPPPSRAAEAKPAQRRVVKGVRYPVSSDHPWGGIELDLDDGSVVFVGNDLLKAAPYR